MWEVQKSTQEHTNILSGSTHQSVIPYVQFFYIAPLGFWSTEFEEADLRVA
jgi:hypothetical protein